MKLKTKCYKADLMMFFLIFYFFCFIVAAENLNTPQTIERVFINDSQLVILSSESVLDTKGEAVALKKTPHIPYTLTFEAQMPEVSRGAPDFGVPQVWFSVDCVNEHDRLQFSIRGGPLQTLNVYDYQQRTPPSPDLDTKSHRAFLTQFRCLPIHIQSGQWFDVRIEVQSEYSVLFVNDQRIMVYERTMQGKGRVTFGDSWQSNKFRKIMLSESEPYTIDKFSVDDQIVFPVRNNYHSDAIKIDFGPANIPVANGWTRVTDEVNGKESVTGWQNKTAGARYRNVKSVEESRLKTLVAFAHGNNDSELSLDLPKGSYLASFGIGDASYNVDGLIKAPNGKHYKANLPAGQWGEIRFKFDHAGGIVSFPISNMNGQGMAVCYLVLEPENNLQFESKSIQESSRNKKDMETRKKIQRDTYVPIELPPLKKQPALNKSLNGKWLIMPGNEIDREKAVSMETEDENWNVIDVPAFWNEVGWWIFGQNNRYVSHRFIIEELDRVESYGFTSNNFQTAYYRNWLDIPSDWEGKRVELEFDAVSSVCLVYFNESLVGSNFGMFKPFKLDVTDHIRLGQKNLLALWVNNGVPDSDSFTDINEKGSINAVTMKVTPDMVRGLPRGMYFNPNGENGKPLLKRQGGIWQDVRISVCDKLSIEDVWSRSDLNSIKLDINASGQAKVFEDAIVEVSIINDKGDSLLKSNSPWSGKVKNGNQLMSMQFNDLEPEHWSPASPNLYTLNVKLKQNGQILDVENQTIGFRKFEVKGNQFYLNGKQFRFLGSNMPPTGLKPNDQKLACKIISLMKQGNQNATRSHGSPFTEVWLKEADRQGIAVSLEGTWPWLMINDSEIPSEESLNVWKEEWFALMKQFRHHPSIVMWTINNETYITHDKNKQRRAKKWDIYQDVIAEMREIDPTRPIVLWSGYSRQRELQNLADIGVDMDKTDDGDIDDVHTYFGTYQPSWIGNPGMHEDWFRNMMIEDRPMISQEAATAYPNTDTGHQETSYMQRWHAQYWMGDGTYPYRNPMPFLNRQARLTKEQIEIVRRMDVAGWLAFSTATWFNDIHVVDEITPYPVYYAVKSALSPVLVSMDLRERQFFTGEKIKPQIFLRNDDIHQRDFDKVKIQLKLRDDSNHNFVEESVEISDVKLASLHNHLFELNLPQKLSSDRETLTIELKATSGDGELLSKNEYQIVVCTKNYLLSRSKPTVFVTGLDLKSPIVKILQEAKINIKHGQPEVPSEGIWLAWKPTAGQSNLIENIVEKGGIVIVQDPETLENFPMLPSMELGSFPSDGEVANVINARTSPLLEDMTEQDVAWWHHTSAGVKVYDKAMRFLNGLPQSAEILVNHIPPHGYNKEWHVQYPLVQFNMGKGKLIISTVNFNSVHKDPFAARFMINMLDYFSSVAD